MANQKPEDRGQRTEAAPERIEIVNDDGFDRQLRAETRLKLFEVGLKHGHDVFRNPEDFRRFLDEGEKLILGDGEE